MVKRKLTSLGEEAEEFLTLKRKSTAKTYRFGLNHFADYYSQKHDASREDVFAHFLDRLYKNFQLPRREQKRLVELEISGFIEYLKKREMSGKSIRVYFAAIQNFLKYYRFPAQASFIGNLPPSTPKKENKKHAWQLPEIQRFVKHAKNYRDKAVILCLFQSGLGVGDLVALDYRDIKKEFEEETLPLCLELTRKKTGVVFKTFLGRDAAHYLKLYLQTRGKLEEDAPLFAMWGSERRVTTGAIEKRFRDLALKLGYINHGDDSYNPCRPHSLRSAFRSQLTGEAADSLIEFWMGHAIGEEKRAYLNLPVEKLRERYMGFEQFLAIEKTSKQERAEIEPPESVEELRERVLELERKVEEDREMISALVRDEKKKVEKWRRRAEP